MGYRLQGIEGFSLLGLSYGGKRGGEKLAPTGAGWVI